MDILFLISIVVYAVVMIGLLLFNVVAIRHILKYRFRGDASITILVIYVILIALLLLVTTFSLMAVSLMGNIGGI